MQGSVRRAAYPSKRNVTAAFVDGAQEGEDDSEHYGQEHDCACARASVWVCVKRERGGARVLVAGPVAATRSTSLVSGS